MYPLNEFSVSGSSEKEKAKASCPIVNFHHMSNSGGVAFSQTIMKYGLAGYHAINYNPESLHELFDKAREIKNQLLGERLYLHGHWTNGFEKLLGSVSYKFTILRSPLDRFLSEFFWERRTAPEVRTPWLLLDEMSRWIDALGEIGHANFYCTEIATYQQDKALFHVHLRRENLVQMSPQEAFSRAHLKLLGEYSFVGITELFEESLFFFFREMGWSKLGPWTRGPHAPGRGGAAKKFSAADLPIRYLKKLRKLLAGDEELYEERRQMFEADLAQRPLKGDFAEYKSRGWYEAFGQA